MACRRAILPLLSTSSRNVIQKLPSRFPLTQTRHAAPLLRPLPRANLPAASIRWSSSATPSEPKPYSFEDVRALSEQPEVDRIIIDVREPHELKETGRVPTAQNMPIKSQPTGLFLSPEEFEDVFGFEKPSEDQEVIFYCKSGVRSQAAARLALQKGYQKVGNYGGSWLDWEGNGGKAER